MHFLYLYKYSYFYSNYYDERILQNIEFGPVLVWDSQRLLKICLSYAQLFVALPKA